MMTDSEQKRLAYQRAAQKLREAKTELQSIEDTSVGLWLAILLVGMLEEILSDKSNQGRRTEDDDSSS